jgi:hypothetical protein
MCACWVAAVPQRGQFTADSLQTSVVIILLLSYVKSEKGLSSSKSIKSSEDQCIFKQKQKIGKLYFGHGTITTPNLMRKMF